MELTPLIDVTFLVLIFFLCTLRFRSLEGKLDAHLPAGGGHAEVPLEKVEVTIEVVAPGTRLDPSGKRPFDERRDARWSYAADRALEYRVGPRRLRGLDGLRDVLARLHRADPSRPLSIDSRAGTVYADVVAVIDLCLEVGYEDVCFVGSHE